MKTVELNRIRSSIQYTLTGALVITLLACSSPQRQTFGPPRNDNGVQSSRIVQAVGPGRLRVLSFNLGDLRLGQCATSGAGLIEAMCVSPPSANVLTDLDLRPDLNAGTFRQYSQRIDIDGSAGFSGTGTVSANTRTNYSRFLLVFEWRRYRYQDLFHQANGTATGTEVQPGRNAVTALEVGIAVRIAFDVRLRSTDASVSAGFGFGNIAAALANQQVDVQVGYEVIGSTLDILPQRPVNISSVDSYMSAMTEFYNAVQRLSSDWNNAVEPAGSGPNDGGAPNAGASDGGRGASPRFRLGVLAYYVSGAFTETNDTSSRFDAGFRDGLRLVASGVSCTDAETARTRNSGGTATVAASGSSSTRQTETVNRIAAALFTDRQENSGDNRGVLVDLDYVAGILAAYQEATGSASCLSASPSGDARSRANEILGRLGR